MYLKNNIDILSEYRINKISNYLDNLWFFKMTTAEWSILDKIIKDKKCLSL